jgi:hypothetical protein
MCPPKKLITRQDYNISSGLFNKKKLQPFTEANQRFCVIARPLGRSNLKSSQKEIAAPAFGGLAMTMTCHEIWSHTGHAPQND